MEEINFEQNTINDPSLIDILRSSDGKIISCNRIVAGAPTIPNNFQPGAIVTDSAGTRWQFQGSAGFIALPGGGGGSPSNPDGSIQFNDGGSFGGDANLSWDKIFKLFRVIGLANQYVTEVRSPGTVTKMLKFNTTALTLLNEIYDEYIFNSGEHGRFGMEMVDAILSKADFKWTLWNGINFAERMRLTNDGNLNIEGTYKTNGVPGVSGTFTTADAKTVTVTNGIITSIV